MGRASTVSVSEVIRDVQANHAIVEAEGSLFLMQEVVVAGGEVS